MTLLLLGVNHRTAPIELRERIAFTPDELAEALKKLASALGKNGAESGHQAEAMILSTCNRVELLAAVESPDVDPARFLYEYFSIEPGLLRPHLYEYRDYEAIRHLFRVAASLDSMVIGEPQILGQVKEAYAVAREAGTVSRQLEPVLQSAFAAAKRARTDTGIASTTVSIASVAVDLAKRIFGSLSGRRIFIVGAGKMSELAARHLMQQGAGRLLITNRTRERAERMAAEIGGEVVPFDQMYEAAAQADIVITSTGSPQPLFRREHAQQFLHRRKNKPMCFIDIAVPRDVSSDLDKLEGIFLYDIDDLQSVAATHMAERQREASEAEALIAAEVERFHLRQRTVNIGPAIAQLHQQAEMTRQAEMRRMQSRLGELTEEQNAAVEALTRSLMNKLLHPGMQALKQAARENDAARLDSLLDAYAIRDAQNLPQDKEGNS